MTQSGHCTVIEAGTILGVSRRTVLRRIASGDLLAEKLGTNTSAWIVNRADCHRLADKLAADRGTAA